MTEERAKFVDSLYKSSYIPLRLTSTQGSMLLKGQEVDGGRLTPGFLKRFYKTFKIPPYDESSKIYQTNEELFDTLLEGVASTLENESIYMLDNNKGHIVEYFTVDTRFPLTHHEFFREAFRQVDSYPEVVLESISYREGDPTASFILCRKDQESLDYCPGILFINDESYAVYCRMVVMSVKDGGVYYLPARSYNLSSARYNSRSDSSLEAFSILLLRVIDEVMSKDWNSSVLPFLDKYEQRKDTLITYEECSRVLLEMRRVASLVSDEESLLPGVEEMVTPLLSDFLKEYPLLTERSHSYLYRCTSVLDTVKIIDLLDLLIQFTHSYHFDTKDLEGIRYLLGDLVMNERIVNDIARK